VPPCGAQLIFLLLAGLLLDFPLETLQEALVLAWLRVIGAAYAVAGLAAWLVTLPAFLVDAAGVFADSIEIFFVTFSGLVAFLGAAARFLYIALLFAFTCGFGSFRLTSRSRAATLSAGSRSQLVRDLQAVVNILLSLFGGLLGLL